MQVQDLIQAQGVQHPDDEPEPPVFAEHHYQIFTPSNLTDSSLAVAFWNADGAQQKVMRAVYQELQALANERV